MAKKKRKASSKEKKDKKLRKQMAKQQVDNIIKNAPNVIIPDGKGAGLIENIWADKGVIKVQRSDGIVQNMHWKSAAYRAVQLNAAVPLLPHAETKRQYLDLVEKILKAVKQARAQIETPDKKTEGLQNLLSGKNEDGTLPNTGRIEDYLIDDYRKQFPTLEEDEIMVVMRADKQWPTIAEKETVLRTINAERLRTQRGEAGTGVADDLISEATR